MKPSKYNYYITSGEKALIYNGLSESHFFVKTKFLSQYQSILQNPDTYKPIYPDFINKMESNGFVINNDIDEMEFVKNKFHEYQRPNEYHLMILPTYQCNLSCWYCIQKHENTWLRPETINAIKKHIHDKLHEKRINSFLLSWFGGEPLLAYDIVLEITTYAKQICSSLNKRLTCSITTNGTLLNKNRIIELAKAGVTHYQITIDGVKEIHDKIKQLPQESAFEKVLKNINLLPSYSECILRFNYTHENLKPVEIINQLNERLSKEAKNNLTFSIQRVWQEQEKNIDNNKVKKLFDLACESNLQPHTHLYGMCYADKPDFNCIFPNGKIGKCDNDGMHEVPAHIDPSGKIVWPNELQYTIPAIFQNDSDCYNCKYLPLCWGPCPANRKKILKKHNRIVCFMADKQTIMEQHILQNTTW